MEPLVLYEDDAVLVVDKPAGLIVHSDGRTDEPTLAEWVVRHYPALKGVGEPWVSPQGESIDRPGIVHRLDRTTSGVMILAKTVAAHAFLKKQFQDRMVSKLYWALVYGHPKEDYGSIEREIVRIKSVPPRWGVARGTENMKRAAVTTWRVARRAADPESGERVSVVEAEPKTGRTHQIRVHLQALGHPIVCDHLYAPTRLCILGLSRVALHARRLTISLPSGAQKTFESPLPPDLAYADSLLVEYRR